MSRELPPGSQAMVQAAIETLFHVTHIRNGGQHIQAATQAAKALAALGLSFPITEHATAWTTMQTHVIDALDTIRTEVNALPTARSARRTSTGGANRARSRTRRPRRGGGRAGTTRTR